MVECIAGQQHHSGTLRARHICQTGERPVTGQPQPPPHIFAVAAERLAQMQIGRVDKAEHHVLSAGEGRRNLACCAAEGQAVNSDRVAAINFNLNQTALCGVASCMLWGSPF